MTFAEDGKTRGRGGGWVRFLKPRLRQESTPVTPVADPAPAVPAGGGPDKWQEEQAAQLVEIFRKIKATKGTTSTENGGHQVPSVRIDHGE